MELHVDKLLDNVQQLKIRFDKVREDIISKLSECHDCIQTAEKLCQETKELNTTLENKLLNASITEEKSKLKSISNKSKILLDIGGEKFATTIETLTREKDSFFTKLFSKEYEEEIERDPNDNSIFIDRDGKLFYHILTYLRTDKLPNDIMTNELLRQLLITEGEYYCLQNLLYRLTEPERKRQKEKEEEEERFRTDNGFSNGTLLQSEQKIQLNEFYGNTNQRWELIYKASRDGFAASTFHKRCNNKGPTMTIIQSNNNYLFGGYTSIPWTSDGPAKTDTTAFLFTLTNPHNIPPTKYAIKSDKTAHAVYHASDHGPTFGAGRDIYLANSSNANNTSSTTFPNSYNDTTGKASATFTGAKNFTASDIEVFKLA